MSYRSRSGRNEVEHINGRGVSPRPYASPQVRQATERAAAIEHGRALVFAARLRGMERVTSEAMQAVGSLAREEAYWVQAAPHAGARIQAIADIAAASIANIVQDAGRE